MGRKSNLPKIIAALEDAPDGLTQLGLQRITGASAGTVHRFVHQLHDEGKAYIASWKTDTAGKKGGGIYQARYRLGKGKDKPKPPAQTHADAYRIAKRKRKKAGEVEEFRAQRAEEAKRRYWAAKQPRLDPLAVAFFGMPASNDSSRRQA
jgi:hypothetical protein